MRKKIVAGNWKMNKSKQEAIDLVTAINERAVKNPNLEKILICPPFVFLEMLNNLVNKDFIELGAQNISSEEKGAFTGEISASMLQSMGIKNCLIGHSERRSYFGESDEILKKKVDVAIKFGLTPIFCCGESLKERKEGRHFKVIESQINGSIFHLSDSSFRKVVIAYEPVWAIGTGETATSDQAEEMHKFIRSLIHSKYGGLSEEIFILYGGSCNPTNAKELFGCKNVDGGLIGGASLVPEDFLAIISSVNG